MRVVPKTATVVSGNPYVQLVHDVREAFRRLARIELRASEHGKSDPMRPPRMFLPEVPVRIDIEPRKLRGHFRDETQPQLTVECPRPSGYPKDFERDVSVRYLRRKSGSFDLDGIVRFALDVAERYKVCDARHREYEAKRALWRQEEEDLNRSLGTSDLGLHVTKSRYEGLQPWYTFGETMTRRMDLVFTEEGLREFVKLYKRESKRVAKLRAQAAALRKSKGEDE